ncbi:MAG: TerC family protein [Acidobacteria bacterium]|nr:TerC family protein [Acidobacteriota bacterium]
MGAGIGTPELWAGFIIFILAMLALDLGVFHRRAHEVSTREALAWSLVWIALALLFNAGIYHWFGRERALEFFTGYLIEKALSVDNLFVFLVLFTYFAVPAALRHRVLFWGILGALVMRALFIAAGTALIAAFHWVLYLFGAFLVFTGLKLLAARDEGIEPERNPVLRLIRRVLPSVPEYHGARFVVRRAGRWFATPLLAVLVMIEATDIVFALDSIPAVFAITRDPFIVFTSNIFAVLGLRALFFLLAGMLGRFRYLKVGLGLVLAFVGVKMLLVDLVRVPIALSLGVIACLLGLSVAASMLLPERRSEALD